MSIISTRSLTRRFGSVAALDDVTLDLPPARIIGLVGPNGSGKSTLIRTLLGLIRPTSGEATVLGESITKPADYAPGIGVLIERPAFIASLSARTNLVSLAHLYGVAPTRADEVLRVVGLDGRDREPVRAFSLGMQQRLGIAAALLTDSRLLILDEPTNGLDPAGIVEIRDLLRYLAADGRTVVVSSHLLSELEAICDHLVIIRFGRLVFDGPMSDLLGRTTAHIDASAERAEDLETLMRALSSAGWEVARNGDGIRVVADADRAADLNRAATAAGVTLSRLAVVHESLEDLYLDMTGRDDGELARARATADRKIA